MKTKIKLMMLAVALLSSGYSYAQQDVTVTVKKDDGMLHYQSEDDNNVNVTVKRDNGMLNYEPSKNVRGLTPYNPPPVNPFEDANKIRKEAQENEMRQLQIERQRLENERLRRENNANNSNNNNSSVQEEADRNRYDMSSYPTTTSNSSTVSTSNNSNSSNSMNESGWNTQGHIYSNQGNHTQAIACYQKSLSINPNFYWANNNIGYEYFLMGEYDNAIPFLEKAIDIDTQNPFSYSNLGGVYLCKNDYYKAIEYCSKALDLKDNYNAYWNGRATLFNFSEPYFYIGLASIMLKNIENATRFLKIAATYNDEYGKKANELLQQIK